MSEQLRLLPGYLSAHLELSLAALCAAALLAIPLGVAIHRRPALEPALLGLASAIQTIPGLALLAVMVPLFVAIGARGIGAWPAWVALTLYGLLPILRNTVIGLAGVDPAVREASRGVGMTPREELWRVELPLALPVIVGGVRTSAVWVVGTATLATPIGATSLGNYIFSGLATRNNAAVLVGCAAAAALALALDQSIRLLEAGIRARRRSWWATAVALLAALVLYAVASAGVRASRSADVISIGAKPFTEQYILAEILGQQIAAQTGVATRSVPSLGSTVAFDALAAGDLDAYVDYSGTIWATIMHRGDPGERRGELLAEVERYLADERGVAVAGALGFENRYALAMRADRARELAVTRIGELARRAPELEIGGDYEFFARAEWRALVAAYGLAFRAQRAMDPSLMYAAVRERQVDVIGAYSTDGRIAAEGLVVLDDDRRVIPPYDAILLASGRLAREHPTVLAALRALAGTIDADAMRRMNAAVDAEGRSPADVAREFLERN
jgi:osmoprotectant transport system substrate-binding protein/osmoprotectant transport system permease protein